MCGISGFVSSSRGVDAVSINCVQKMLDQMQQRGPDAKGVWQDQSVVLGHRRLAILDLDERSDQPMHTVDLRYSIVFNGEIYNFRELRRDLEAEGVEFRTTSDTEVLLILFAREGERMLPRLRGMFALAIWDKITHELFLARDPYGIKPLYYSHSEKGFLFASQVKAILASTFSSREMEPAGVAGFFLWGSVPEPWTLYRDIFALPAGSWLRLRDGQVSGPHVWKDIRSNWQREQASLSPEDMQEQVRLSVTESVQAHLVSDVPVSVFLSGGIDSGAVAGLIAEYGNAIEGITIAFDEFADNDADEVPGAIALASHYGIKHHIRKFSRAEFYEHLPRIMNAMDQPSIDGINTWFASKAAAERGYKVVLSGVGGDELFTGYNHMQEIPVEMKRAKIASAIPGAFPLIRFACRILAERRGQPKLKGVPDFLKTLECAYFLQRGLFLPEELPQVMDAEVAREGLARLGGDFPKNFPKVEAFDPVAGICMLDSTLYLKNQLLRDSDWASMDHSLELRTPLTDARLLEQVSPIFKGFRNAAGKKMLAYSPRTALPREIVERPKTGFGVPMAKWLAESPQGFKTTAKGVSMGTSWARQWALIVFNSLSEGQ